MAATAIDAALETARLKLKSADDRLKKAKAPAAVSAAAASLAEAERNYEKLKRELTNREELHIPQPFGESLTPFDSDSDNKDEDLSSGSTETGTNKESPSRARAGRKRTSSARCAVKNIIANSPEKFMCFTVGHNTFVDSCLFLSASLAQLADTLSETDKKITRMRFAETDEMQADDEGFSLVCQKGIFPYEHLTSLETFEETELPPIEKFYSHLALKTVTPQAYEFAHKVWRHFKCRNIGDYHDLYLQTDVTLLADVFEKFRKTCMENYKLDPAHYMTGPQLTWDAMLLSRIFSSDSGLGDDDPPELLTDMNMYTMAEEARRGGVAMVVKRYAETHSVRLGEVQPAAQPVAPAAQPDAQPSAKTETNNVSLMYLDANNLYGCAMMSALPHSDFRYEEPPHSEEELMDFLCYVQALPDDGPDGMMIRVDLDYPEHLHELHSDLPLCPQKEKIPYEMLSPLQHTMHEKFGIKPEVGEKLINSLGPRIRYVLDYRMLKLAMELGLICTRVHDVLAYTQKAWLRPYIELNTRLRAASKSDFEKDLFKLMNNAIYGKTMENVRDRVQIKLIAPGDNRDYAANMFTSRQYKSHKIFTDNTGNKLTVVRSTQPEVKLNKPIMVGATILDLSKLTMYKFWYGVLKHRYGSRVRLCYTDTDSLLFEAQTENIYRDMMEDSEHYDFSDYPKGHPMQSDKNKKVVGKMKDETNGRPILEFVGLRAKSYSLQISRQPSPLSYLACGVHGPSVREVLASGMAPGMAPGIASGMAPGIASGMAPGSQKTGTNEESPLGKRKNKGTPMVVVREVHTHQHYKDCLFEMKERYDHVHCLESKNYQMGLYKHYRKTLSPLDTKRYILPDNITTLPFRHAALRPVGLTSLVPALGSQTVPSATPDTDQRAVSATQIAAPEQGPSLPEPRTGTNEESPDEFIDDLIFTAEDYDAIFGPTPPRPFGP